MANINSALLATLESIPFYSIKNDAVREQMHQAKAALQVYFMYGNEPMKKKFFMHLNVAQAMIRASLPIDYTSKKTVIEETWFDAAPPKQEIDEEDTIVSFLSSSKYPTWMDYQEWKATAGQSHCQSKSKAKGSRSGKQARVLSNR